MIELRQTSGFNQLKKMKFFHPIMLLYTGAALSTSIGTSQAQIGVRTVDPRISIFGAGNAGISSDGSGLAPIPFALIPGSGRTLSFLSVTGSIGAVGQQGFDPDGGNLAGYPCKHRFLRRHLGHCGQYLRP